MDSGERENLSFKLKYRTTKIPIHSFFLTDPRLLRRSTQKASKKQTAARSEPDKSSKEVSYAFRAIRTQKKIWRQKQNNPSTCKTRELSPHQTPITLQLHQKIETSSTPLTCNKKSIKSKIFQLALCTSV